MKPLLVLLSLALTLPLAAQEVKMSYDEQCGCDLMFVDGVETTREGDLYGFRLEDGTQIVPNIYRFVDQFRNGYCRVMLDDGQMGLIDRTGRQVVPCIYDAVGYPSDGRVSVVKADRYGYTDLQGREVVPPVYLSGGDYSEGLAPVLVVIDSFFSACTFIDTLGRELFPPVYENLQPFTCGHALVRRYSRWGLIDHDGREVLTTRFENMTTLFGDTLFFAGDADGMALYDRRMQPLTPAVYTWTGGMQCGRIPVCREGRYGFLDRTGREVIPCRYDEISLFYLDRAMVRLGDRYGIIDTAGRFVLPLEYENRTPFGEKYVYRDSLALVERDGRLGYVDLDGRLAIPYYFDQAFHFSEGLASVCRDGLWGYIDTHGDLFLPLIFDLASPYRWGRAEVSYAGELRRVDRRGRCVKNCKGIIAWRDWTE